MIFLFIWKKQNFQLDNPDEQAAAIRREVATREEALRDIHKVKKFDFWTNWDFQMKRITPKFVVKDMETLYMDEVKMRFHFLFSSIILKHGK